MAILGIFTNQGITKAQQAQNDEGFKIYPTDFSVSDTPGLLDPTRTLPNAEWFVGPISSRVVVDYNTIKFICTIPPGATLVNRTIREIYIKGLDQVSNPFLFVIAQPSTPIVYDPSGSVTFEIDLSLANADISSIVVFNFTQATEINEHNLSPNAHPEIQAALNKAGLFTAGGSEPFKYRGQTFDEKAEWAGVKASITHGGLVWTATHTGLDGNLITLAFDGVKTADQVRLTWNNANPNNTVEHNGAGTEVIAAGSTTLINGSLSVSHGDAVYRDTDNFYKRALADGTLASKVVGFADLDAPTKRIVRSTGFVAHDTTGFLEGDNIFLSTTVPGGITNVSTPVQMGFVVKAGLVLIGTGSGGGGSAEGFDAVVTNSAGFGKFPTTTLAIANCPDGGRILVDKMDYLTAQLNPVGKRIDFIFNGPEAGWSKYLGTKEKQRVSFGTLPDSGTWRIEWNGDETPDLAFNANAAAVKAAVDALVGPALPVTVTGSFGAGFFDIEWTALLDVPQITFANVGQNERQHIAFSAVPDNGTVQFDFGGQLTANFAWNDNASILEGYLEALSNITDVVVTGSFAAGFDIEWVNVDGNKNQPLLIVNANTLQIGVTAVNVNITTVQPGKVPANSLFTGATPVSIVVQTLVQGSPAGPTTAISVGKDYTRFSGLGLLENFAVGIDLNGKVGVDVEMQMKTTTLPILHTGLKPRRDYHRDKSFGMVDPVVMYVGAFGDYLTMALAVAAAGSGDKIIVNEDQSIVAPLLINKEIEIEFINDAKLHVAAHMVGDVITFDGPVKTKNWKILLDQPGVYDTALKFAGLRGHHLNMRLDLDDSGVSVNNAFEMGPTCQLLYLDACLARNAATLTNVLASSTGFGSNNIFIRDKEFNMVHNTLSDTSMEEDVYPLAGQTVINFNVLRFDPANSRWDLKVDLDGVKQKQDPAGGLAKHYRKLSNASIESAFPYALGERVTGRMEKTALTALGSQPYFVNYYQGLSGTLQTSGDSFNPGTNKLSLYRNGVYQLNHISMGIPGERYTEVSANQVLLGLAAIAPDWFAFINEDVIPARNQQTGLSGIVLTVPTYIMGSGRLRVFRNGVLMNTSGFGTSADQYTEISTTSIQLALLANPSDTWTFYVASVTPVFRSNQSGISGSLITTPSAYVMGDERLLVFKNGLLLLNHGSFATAAERYQETSTTTLTTGAAFVGTDWFTLIYK